MIRTFHSFQVHNIETIKHQMLNLANGFNICCFLDNHNYESAYHSEECIAGIGVLKLIDASQPIEDLQVFLRSANDYVFGHFSYEFKSQQETPEFRHPDHISFPNAFLFIPEIVLRLRGNLLEIGVIDGNANRIFEQICNEKPVIGNIQKVDLIPRIEKDKYLAKVIALLRHIHMGDCYEINFCQEFFAEGVEIDPLSVYRKLSEISPNPFAAYYKVNDHFLLCASPERFLKKEGDKLISQPIKGTAPRGANSEVDNLNKHALKKSAKERAENVMIVDLVRNDLSKICEAGSVKVDELFGIYSFPNVHQMVSTISGTIKKGVEFVDMLKATFPMGSMTGAPKKRVMELTEQYEESKRGIYSGSVGYITPSGDFDFNVVIRSIVYNSQTGYLSYHAGGGITANSIPENEYEECLLKGKAIGKVLSGS